MADRRSELKQGQIDILELLYKYRFGSRQLIADSLDIKAGSSLHEKLQVLIKHEYITMRHEKHLKLFGVPAAYHLTPKGLRKLAALPGHDYITESVLKASYRDKIVSRAFVDHCLCVYAKTNQLKAFYPKLKVYLRRDMSRYSYFPSTPPDAFLSLPNKGNPKRFFMDILPDIMPTKSLYQRVMNYTQFFEEGNWDSVSDEPPVLLFMGETSTTERRLQRLIRSALRNAELDEDIAVYTTTFGAVEHIEGEDAIWTSLDEPDELLALEDL